jgi:hypothetical protein
MRFLAFIAVLACFYWLFWHVFYLIISLPAAGLVSALERWFPGFPDEPTGRKRAIVWLLISLVFLLGTVVPATLYATAIFAIVSFSAHTANHPWLYITFGALCSFVIVAPNGETNVLGIVISFISYACLTLLPFSGQFVQTAIHVVRAAMGHAILLFAIVLLLAFLRSYMFGSRAWAKDLLTFGKTAMRDGKAAMEAFTPELRDLVRGGLTLGRRWDEQTTLFGRVAAMKAQAALLEYRYVKQKQASRIAAGTYTNEQAAEAVATLMNDNFGGLHLRRMGKNPTWTHIKQIVLLPPDWTISNLRSVAGMFRRGVEGHLYRL